MSDGLVNGARGTAQAIIKTGSEVTLVLVEFDHSQVGAKAIQYNIQKLYLSANMKQCSVLAKNKAAEVSRR